MKTSSIIIIFILISCFAALEVMGSEIRLDGQFQKDINPMDVLQAAIHKSNPDSITKIGNYVWRDINKNGIQESSDFPLKGVRIELVNYDSYFVVASAKSDAKGQYEFETDESIEPGYYYLKFSCFEKFIPTLRDVADEASDSDIDESGKTDTFYLPSVNQLIDHDAGFYLDYPDICEDQTAFECFDAENYSFTELNHLCFKMTPAFTMIPIPGCGSGYAFHNPAWFGFIAGDTIANFLIHTYNCVSGGNNIGLQWGVYDNCDMNNMIAGSCPCVDPKEIYVNLNGLIEGTTYYLFIDGCSGTTCCFRVEWLSGYCTEEVPDAESISCYGEDIDSYYFCGGKNYKFFTDTLVNADKYTWQVGDEIIETENPELNFTFKKSGSTFISVFGSNFCSNSDPYSKNLYVLDTIYGDLGKINATPEQLKAGFLPSGWKGPPIIKYGKDSVLVVNSFGCGQWQFIEVVENPDYINLMAFYYATNGTEWNNNSGWKEGADSTNCDPCNGWYGVKCNEARVTSIELPGNKLYGQIPKELYNLSELKYLALNNNELYGVLPDSISKLKNLEYLNLGNNWYTIPVPWDISNLHNLEYLYLNGNQFYHMRSEIFKMTSLVELDLSDNNMSGQIPDFINMPDLEILNLSNNNFYGQIPPAIGDCKQLFDLGLNKNRFNGSIPPELSKLKSLWRLDLSENQLSGTIPENLGNISGLTILYLNDNNLEGEILDKITSIKELGSFTCDNNGFTGTIGSEIGLLADIKYISASNNMFEGQLPVELFNPGLSHLDLSNNNFSGMLPAKIVNSKYLDYLDLSFNNFDDTIPKEIGMLKYLKSLLLNDNNFSGLIPRDIGKLYKLQFLNMKNNQFEGSIPSEIGDMYSLIDFNASNNMLTGSLPASVGDLSQLTSLDLNHNNLTGSVPKEMGKLYQIKKINFKDNNLSGCYPEELKQLCKSGITKIFNNNELLPWKGDFYRYCGTDDQIGAPCNDGDDTNGTNDKIDIDCKCIGTVATHDTGTGKISFNNPVNDFLILNSEVDINSIQIFDFSGTNLKIYMEIKSPVFEIDMSDLPGGIYIMKVMISNNENIIKLIKI